MRITYLFLAMVIFIQSAMSAPLWKVVDEKYYEMNTTDEFNQILNSDYSFVFSIKKYLKKLSADVSKISTIYFTVSTYKYVGSNTCAEDDARLFYTTNTGSIELVSGDMYTWYPNLPENTKNDPCNN